MIRRLATFAVLALAASWTASAADRSTPGYQGPGKPIAPVASPEANCPGTAIAALPYNNSSTTCGESNSITNYDSNCAANLPFPYPGPEKVYQVTLGATNNIGFSADLTGSAGDLALFLVNGSCGSGSTCVDNSQDSIGAGAGPEVIDPATYPAGTYFLYVDSYYGAGSLSCGTYALSVTGTLPAELVEFAVD